ncbi:CRE-TPK-1 protein [Caenorhabditis remanei]|uniref:CRE-TPK-1 protein n=1 Tax=Caenorhabditis remanei TaxID=31234 RepID=E3N076_CAERE|nr:CRE-TPK-1 protein [Caenorhabditis remanei]
MNRYFHPFKIFTKPETSVSIWLNGEPGAIQKEAENIWNSSKYRVATDGAINEITKRHESVEWPHAICGDFDSIDKKIDMRGAKVIHLPDQDHTDLTKTIEWCLEQKNEKLWSFDRITLLGGLNGRFDHTMSTLSTLVRFVRNETPIIVLDSCNLVFSLPEVSFSRKKTTDSCFQGESKIYVDLEKTTKMCGVIPIAQKETILTSNGLKYEMDSLPLAFGELVSSSNEVVTNEIKLKSTAPLIFTIDIVK